jgi:hypothetical protein
MPLEERYITFNLDEVYESVKMRCVHENLPQPVEGQPTLIEMEEQNVPEHVIINIHVKKKGDAPEEKVPFERTFFAKALVFFCQGSGIPLPAKGKKTLSILDDKIIMKIEMESRAK